MTEQSELHAMPSSQRGVCISCMSLETIASVLLLYGFADCANTTPADKFEKAADFT